jgi:membrane associated rhomboid family serine protease
MSGAIGSAIFALSANNNVPYNVLNVGASGSTSAILSFFILNFPHEKIYIYFIPCPAWLFGMLLF